MGWSRLFALKKPLVKLFQLDVAQVGASGVYGNNVIFLFDDETRKEGNWCRVRYLDI